MIQRYDPIEVGTRIRKIRQHLGWSMEKFASKIDDKAKSGTVSNWETGKNLPNNERLKRIAELGKITPEYLLSGNPFDNLSLEEQEHIMEKENKDNEIQEYIQKFKEAKYPMIDDLMFKKRCPGIGGYLFTEDDLEKIKKLVENKKANCPTHEEIEKEYYALRNQKIENEKNKEEGKSFVMLAEFYEYDFHE